MKNIELVKASQDLLSQANQLELIEKLLEFAEHSRVSGDTFVVNNFLQTNTLDLIIENINSVREAINQISNSICPKSEGDKEI